MKTETGKYHITVRDWRGNQTETTASSTDQRGVEEIAEAWISKGNKDSASLYGPDGKLMIIIQKQRDWRTGKTSIVKITGLNL